MREIKFRAYSKIQKRILDVVEIRFNTKCFKLSDSQWYEFDEAYLTQFTGLLDKNGREIFEGDILRTEGIDNVQLWKVDYEMSSDVMGFSCNCISGSFSSCHNEVWDEGEVVGNIYNPPELLEGKENSDERD